MAAILPAFVLGMSGCGILGSDGPADELEARRASWRAADVRQYRMEFRASCYCLDEFTERVTVEVRDDSVASVIVLSTGEPVQHVPVETWPTVDDLFDVIEDAIAADAYVLEVTYNSEWGYPTLLYVDRDEMVADDEIRYWIFALEPLS